MDCCLDYWMRTSATLLYILCAIVFISLLWWIITFVLNYHINKRIPTYIKNIFNENDLLRHENRKYKQKFGEMPKDSDEDTL